MGKRGQADTVRLEFVGGPRDGERVRVANPPNRLYRSGRHEYALAQITLPGRFVKVGELQSGIALQHWHEPEPEWVYLWQGNVTD